MEDELAQAIARKAAQYVAANDAIARGQVIESDDAHQLYRELVTLCEQAKADD